MRVHEFSLFPGHLFTCTKLKDFSLSLWGGRHTEGLHLLLKGKAWALASLPGVCGLSWTQERGVPPRGCATVNSGRMRSFLHNCSSFLKDRILISYSLHCLLMNLKTTLTPHLQKTVLSGKPPLKHIQNVPGIFLHSAQCTIQILVIVISQELKHMRQRKKTIDFSKASCSSFHLMNYHLTR